METESENSNFSFPMGQNRANDHSNPYIESTTVLSDIVHVQRWWDRRYMYVLYTGMYMYIHVNKNVIIPCCIYCPYTVFIQSVMYVDYQITHNIHNTLRTYTLYVLHTVLTHT